MPSRIDRFQSARRDPELTVLEGFHAVKHALRFGAQLLDWVTCDPSLLAEMARRLAPDLVPHLAQAVSVTTDELERLAPRPHPTRTLALARCRRPAAADVLAGSHRPVVFLERPTHLGNLGAVIRVAAAAGAAGVVVSGDHDPWHPDSVRAAAGLQFALPVGRCASLPQTSRPVVALVIHGDRFRPHTIESNAVLAFGTERDGLSAETLDRADRRVSLPMQPGVASLNLATAVAATLYAWELAGSNNRSIALPNDDCSASARASSTP